jgi:hypothetical protein
LSKRLNRLLIDYISNSELSEEDAIELEYNTYVIASKKLLKNKAYDIGFKLLKKAKKKCPFH